MTKLSTITCGSRSATLYLNESLYIVLATLNHGETIARTFSGKSWKTPKGATRKIMEWINA